MWSFFVSLGVGLLLFCLLGFFGQFMLDCRSVSSASMDKTFWTLCMSFQVDKILCFSLPGPNFSEQLSTRSSSKSKNAFVKKTDFLSRMGNFSSVMI